MGRLKPDGNQEIFRAGNSSFILFQIGIRFRRFLSIPLNPCLVSAANEKMQNNDCHGSGHDGYRSADVETPGGGAPSMLLLSTVSLALVVSSNTNSVSSQTAVFQII